jgi:hypothetical protein
MNFAMLDVRRFIFLSSFVIIRDLICSRDHQPMLGSVVMLL